MQKFVRRNKLMVTAGAAVATALVAGTAVSSWQAIEANRARNAEKEQRLAAQTERDKAQAAQKEAEQSQQAEKQARLRADHLLYVANMNLAQQAWEQNNIGRLRQVLQETQESPYRGFEWYYWQPKTHSALKTLRGHLGIVWSVAFSPDGRRIVTGSLDKTARVWEAARPEQVAIWQQEERTAAQYLAALQRERTAEEERDRIVRARDSIRQWLILAPIPLAAGQSGADGLDIEQIAGEGGLRPKEGEVASIGGGGLKWRQVALTNEVLDFNLARGQVTTQSVAYAVCYIRSEAAQRGLQMLVGSDDEAKVYLNGKEVYKHSFVRTFFAEQDKVPDIALNAELNVLVFKVVNELGDWQGSVRFTDAQGNPVKGVQVTLNPDAKD